MPAKTVIEWPLSTSPGQRPQEGRGRLINLYAEPLGEQSGAVWHRAPGVTAYGAETVSSNWNFWGLEVFPFGGPQSITLPSGVFRGGIFVNNVLYALFGIGVYKISQGGSFLQIGSIGGTDKAFFARNNNNPPDIAVVAQTGVFLITTTSVLTYPDLDVGSPTCVVGAEGFFIFGYGNGDMVSTDVNSTNVNLLNLARTETNPDGVDQMIYYSGQLYAFGKATVEIFGLPVNPTGFPFNRVGYNVVPGLKVDHAVAGFEPEFGQPPIYVASDHTVRWLVGDQPQKISGPDLDRLIEAVAGQTDTNQQESIEALVYVSNGVPFWQVSGPDWTWVFNCLNQKWHERTSYLMERSRLTGSVFAFGTWLCGDTLANGRMLEITGDAAKEINDPFIPLIESIPVEDFPINVACPRADFEFCPE